MERSERIRALRMERQYLIKGADEAEYDALFRDCAPVPPEGWCEPGSPPTLTVHAAFDDHACNFRRRQAREILKGRFTGDKRIGYVPREDLELFACLARRNRRLSPLEERLLELLRQEGPMNIALMKEFTGLLVKEITPALHKLQADCLIFEDQTDGEGDRGWFLFQAEFPDVNPRRWSRMEALARLLPRFAYRNVRVSPDMIRSFYQLPLKEIRAALEISGLEPEDGGFLLPEDRALLSSAALPAPEPGVLLLQRNDFLAKSNAYWLGERFSPAPPWEVLQYLLIDGELRGAVIGRFKFGPPVVEDIVTDLPGEEQLRRRDEILAAVSRQFPPEESPPRLFGGHPLG